MERVVGFLLQPVVADDVLIGALEACFGPVRLVDDWDAPAPEDEDGSLAERHLRPAGFRTDVTVYLAGAGDNSARAAQKMADILDCEVMVSPPALHASCGGPFWLWLRKGQPPHLAPERTPEDGSDAWIDVDRAAATVWHEAAE